MSKLRVALCITDLEVGGAERCLTELAIRLDRNRFSPVVYCLAPEPQLLQSALLHTLEAAQIEVQCLAASGTWDFFRVIRQLSGMFREQGTQVVQTFLFHANIVGRIAARRAGVPWVVSGLRVAQRTGRWHLWLDRLTDRLVDRHVCVSRAVARFAEQESGLPAQKMVVIPNGVDLSRFPAPQPADLSALGIGADRKLIAFVGRLDCQKGVPWLLDMAATWLPRLPKHDLLLVGKGPQEKALRDQCRRLGIANRIHFAGWRPDIPAVLAASCLLLLPSAWEGMPNVVLEAMASRLPVVASDVEGVRELLGPGVAQQVAPFGDSQAFSARIVELIENPRIAAQLGLQNRDRAEKTLPFTRMVAAYQDLWESLLASQK